MKKQLIQNADGRFKVLSSDGKKYYNTTSDRCECIGFHTRGQCRHMKLVAETISSAQPTIIFDKEVYDIEDFTGKFPTLSVDQLVKIGKVVINSGKVYIV